MPTFRPIKTTHLSKEVEKQIRQSIVNGAYKPGDKLPAERELVQRFKVSRVTVREALKDLQSSGLITIKRGIYAGAYVSDLKPDPMIESVRNLIMMGKVDFSHLIHARLCIEPQAAKALAAIRTDDDIKNLTDLLDEAESHLSHSPRKAQSINSRFHFEIVNILQNPLLTFISESITQNYSSVLLDMSHKKLDKDEIRTLINFHRNILDSIIRGEASEAYEKTRGHLLEFYEMCCNGFRKIFDKKIERIMKLS